MICKVARFRCLVALATVCVAIGAVGCGGGGGSASSHLSKSALAKQRMASAARMSRSVLAVTGLGRTITRAGSAVPHRWFGSRLPQFFVGVTRTVSAPAPTAPVPVLDPGSGLYYITTINADGSGNQMLFADAAGKKPAGWFKWLMPVWTTPKPPTYPAMITVTYKITAGSFSGVAGTMRITVNDPNFGTGAIELVISNSLHESAKANFDVSQEGVTGKQNIDLGNGDTCSVDDTYDLSNVFADVFTFPDGVIIDMNTQPDGSSTETYTDPAPATDNPVDASGNVSPDGTDTIDYSTGETSSVNVDPGTYDNSSDNSGDSTDSSKKVQKSVKPAPGARPKL